MDEYQNLVAGRAVPSVGAGRFEVRAGAEPWAALANLPRSGARDLSDALERIEPGPCPGDFLRGLEVWEPSATLQRLTGLRLGLESKEVEALSGAWRLPPSGEAVEGDGRNGHTPGVAVIAPGWSRFATGLLEPLIHELSQGRAVLLLSDARLPWIAAELAEELLEHGLPPERLALLHGLEASAWKELARDPRVVAVHALGERGRSRSLRREFEGRASTLPPLETRLEPDRTCARVIAPGDDLDREADETVRFAFGRVETLSGQRHGQLGRVFCPEEVYSSFTACVLDRLEGAEECSSPVPQIDDAALERARALEERGLDEGATLIHGGERLTESGRERRLVPSVFVNVEPGGVLARHPDPAPCLALVRVPRQGQRG